VGAPPRRARRRTIAGLALAAALVSGCSRGAAIREDALRSSTPVTFESSDGVELSGRLFGPEDARVGVVLSHMRPADQSSWFDFADQLGDDGYRVLTYDFRGYCPGGDAGCSGGETNVAEIWRDVVGAADLLRSEGVGDVALIGASMGGTASLVAAERLQGLRAVITLSAPISIEGLAVSEAALASLPVAKLFIAGLGDTAAANDASRMYDGSTQPKRVEILTTDDHGTDILSGNQGEQSRNLITGYLAQFAPVAGSDQG
jgi:pimeloyl-ACP methyl ester carboxylesterase